MRKPSFPRMLLILEVRDRNGKLIERRQQESNTFVYNFIKLLHDAFMNTNINLEGVNATQVTL